MKKVGKTLLIAVLAAGVCLAAFVGGIYWNSTDQMGKVEHREIKNTSAIVKSSVKMDEKKSEMELTKETEPEPEVDSDADNESSAVPVSMIIGSNAGEVSKIAEEEKKTSDNGKKVSDDEINFTNGSEKGFAISRKDAVASAMNSMPKDTVIEDKNVSAVLSALNTASGKFYVGYINLSKDKRYFFKVNAMTGKVQDNDFYVLENGIVWYKASEKSNNVERTIQEYSMDAFTKVKLDLGYWADCEIVEGDNYSVCGHFYGEDCSYSLEGKVKDKTLTIKSRVDNNNFSWNCRNQRMNYIRITVPDKTQLEGIDIGNTCGDVLIKGIQAKQAELQLVSGDVNINSCSLGQLTTDVTSGNIRLDQWTKGKLRLSSVSGDIRAEDLAGDIQIETTSGDVNFGSVSAKDNPKIQVTSGDIKIDELNGGTATIETTSGDITVKKTKDCQLDVNVSSGDIRISHMVSGKVDIESMYSEIRVGQMDEGSLNINNSSGDVDIENVGALGKVKIDVTGMYCDVDISCKGKKEDYSYKLKTSYGDNRVGSKSSEETMSQTSTSGNSITVDNESGDNSLTFSK